jgi:hypothetical protein
MAFQDTLLFEPPYIDYKNSRFRIRPQQSSMRTRGGGSQAIEFGPSAWEISLVSGPLHPDEHGRLEAWFDAGRGAFRPFYLYDPKRLFPRTYPSGFSGLKIANTTTDFTGTAADVTALGAYSISIGQLPASFALRMGDYIGLVEGSRRALHRVTEDVNANSSGVVTAVVVPEVRTNLFTTAATANFNRPKVIAEAVAFEGDADSELSPVTMRFLEVIR